MVGDSSKPICMLDLGDLHRPIRGALSEAFERVLDRGQFVLGAEVEAFELALTRELGACHGVGVSSGSDALVVALLALGIGPGDEVITSPFTFFATAGAIARVGARPVFADIASHGFVLDSEHVAAAVTSRTRAVIPVHLFGQFVDLSSLQELCKKHGLALIEDAAQALGARRKGECAGTVGDAGCYSFFPTKNLGGFGDGGFVTCRDTGLAERVRLLRTHGAKQRGSGHAHDIIGGNFRLDALQAALLQVKLPLLAEHNRARRHHAQQYATMFSQAQLDPAMVRWPQPITDDAGETGGHVFNQYTLRVPTMGESKAGASTARDSLAKFLAHHQVDCAVYYPTALHLQPCFASLGYVRGQLPHCEQACDDVLSIPVHPSLSEADVARVAELVIDWTQRVSS